MDTDKLQRDFLAVALTAGTSVAAADLSVQQLPAPHKPTNLPKGKMAAYIFLLGDKCLKVGKAGPKSNARFLSQHYLPQSSRSNLANSILNRKDRLKSLVTPDNRLEIDALDDSTISQWIKTHTSRVDFLLQAKYPAFVLNLLEAFLQCHLNPEFEGKLPEYDDKA